jgi:hypothetical protein
MNDTSEGDARDRTEPILEGTVFHVRIPRYSSFMCGTEPLSGPVIVKALKLFMADASTIVFTLEIQARA